MKPSRDDVFQMTAALMTVLSGIERAKKSGQANTLATMQIIASRQPVRPSDIALDLGVHQSTMTRQIQTLETGGMVEVAPDPEDRRSCFITLTEAGQDEIARMTEIGLSRFAAFVEDWDAEEVQTLARLLMKFEQSKAKAAPRETRPEGRRWQKKT